MRKFYRHLYKKEKGFTLVELMIVIIILAVLTGIAVPSYLALRNRARESATESEMKNIATALELYMADVEVYPTAATTAVIGKYMNPVPTADKWAHGYVYVCADPFSTYTLTSLGVDGAVGGDDIVFTNGQMTSTGAY